MDEITKHIQINNKDIYLLGTAHVSKLSAKQVKEAIAEINPDTVCIELDEKRFNSIKNPDQWKNSNIIDVIKNKQTNLLLVNLILGSYQRKVAKQMDAKAGVEMMEAINICEHENRHLELVDRNIQTTFSRIFVKHSLWQKMKLITNLIFSIFDDEEINEEDIESLKQTDTLNAALSQVEKQFPIVAEVLIDERNKILAHNIKNAQGKVIFAVVGAAHIPGILEYIYQDYNIQELMVVPPKSTTSKLSGWIIPILLILMILFTFTNDFNQGLNQLLSFALITGGLSALGTLIALGHPLSILTAFIAAPIASLNPLLASGWFAGLMEAHVRKPQVKDLENLQDDAMTIKTFMKNRFTHTLLVVIMANVFCSIGTIIAGLDIFIKFTSQIF